jgi:hypothetical protein
MWLLKRDVFCYVPNIFSPLLLIIGQTQFYEPYTLTNKLTLLQIELYAVS